LTEAIAHPAHLAKNGEYERLEDLWSKAVEDLPPIEPFREAVEVLVAGEQGSRAVSLAMQLAEKLEKAGRAADAVTLMAPVVRAGAHSPSFSVVFLRCLETAMGKESWFAAFRERAGLTAGVTATAFERFERLTGFLPGKVVYHRNGWGEGLVQELDLDKLEIHVAFSTGKTVNLPLQSAEDSLTPLARNDLRAMKLLARDELVELCKQDPANVIRMAARLYRNKITGQQLKEMLVPSVLTTAQWNSFWKSAKSAATADPYIHVEGSAARPLFNVRERPMSLADEAKAAIRAAEDVAGSVAALRGFIARAAGDETSRSTILGIAEELASRFAGVPPNPAFLELMLMLTEFGRAQPPLDLLKSLLDARATAEEPFRLLHDLRNAESRTMALRLLPLVLGDGWTGKLRAGIHSIPFDLQEEVVEVLVRESDAKDLAQEFAVVAPYPQRFPVTIYLLARLQADGVFEGHPQAPRPEVLLRVLLHLTRWLSSTRRATPENSRLLNRIVTLLVGKKDPLLPRLLAQTGREELESAYALMGRSGNDFPEEVAEVLIKAARDRFPDLLARPEEPFWEKDVILTTRKGLARRQEEFRILRDVKIPENSRAIGAAASHGDLSENSEWEAAIEDQRNLTQRATEMEAELRKARLLEECELPEDVVAPGTRVTLSDFAEGAPKMCSLLGPWDQEEEEGVISYLAPLAKGLLGKRAGDVTTIQTPGGKRQVRIEKIEPLFRG
jgi:transcription elongation factor GreA